MPGDDGKLFLLFASAQLCAGCGPTKHSNPDPENVTYLSFIQIHSVKQLLLLLNQLVPGPAHVECIDIDQSRFRGINT